MSEKQNIKLFCLQNVQSKIDKLKLALSEAQSASSNETKSTAGDKHETSRAMADLEKERLGKQLNSQNKLFEALSKINVDALHSSINIGSWVETTGGNFFIGVGLGALEIDDKSFFAISLNSPIGRILEGKQTNDTFLFKNKNQTINKIL